MILKRRVTLNGIYLDELDDRIVISGIEPGEGKENISAMDSAAGFGSRVTSKRRSFVDVVIKFKILQRGRSKAGMQARSKVLDMVNAWAAPGGVLKITQKSGQRLNVILAQPATDGSLWDYNKEFQLTFRAYTIPYWEDSSANSVTSGSGASVTKTITVEGSAPTTCAVTLENRSGKTINSISSVKVGSNTMSFSSLGLAGGESLVIDHNDAILRVRIKNAAGKYRSAMAARSGADDFIVNPGDVVCSFASERSCRMTIAWRARYL